MLDITKTLRRMEAKQDQILRGIETLSRAAGLIILLERQDHMATKETLDRMVQDVTDNTNAVNAATAAISHLTDVNADLTQQLQDAIAIGDEDAIKSAADAIEENNTALKNATPQIAQAIVANTPAA